MALDGSPQVRLLAGLAFSAADLRWRLSHQNSRTALREKDIKDGGQSTFMGLTARKWSNQVPYGNNSMCQADAISLEYY